MERCILKDIKKYLRSLDINNYWIAGRVCESRKCSFEERKWGTGTSDILLRGPWVINLFVLNRMLLMCMLFKKVYISGYAGIQKDDSDAKAILEKLSFLIKAGKIEAYAINYHNYFDMLGRSSGSLHYIFDMNSLEFWVSLGYTESDSADLLCQPITKIYNDAADDIYEAPIISAGKDLEDKDFVRELMKLPKYLSMIRMGDYNHDLYRRLWPRYLSNLKAEIDDRASEGYQWAIAMRQALETMPITLIDYAYYLNLTMYWLILFFKCSISFSHYEEAIWRVKAKSASKYWSTDDYFIFPRVQQFFEFPSFKDLYSMSNDEYLDLSGDNRIKSVQDWIKSVNFQSDEEYYNNIEGIINEAAKTQSKKSLTKNFMINQLIGISGCFFPLLNLLPFSKDLYQLYSKVYKKPVLAISLDLLK
jgi:hypothetical protein